MTVKGLRKLLEKMDDGCLVVLSKDSEGNGFSPLADDYSTGRYIKENSWSGEFSMEDEDKKKGVKAVCLWPTN